VLITLAIADDEHQEFRALEAGNTNADPTGERETEE
jgi:hypothetical protein